MLKLTEANVPQSITHKFTFRNHNPTNNDTVITISGGNFLVSSKTPLAISPPLEGSGWLAMETTNQFSKNFLTQYTSNGKTENPKRFATDWVKIDMDLNKMYINQGLQNRDWYVYGEIAISVAEGIVTYISDGMSDNEPFATIPLEMTPEQHAGNYVIVELGNGYNAIYSHLKPYSMDVKVGDYVKVGNVIGLVGNSGNSSFPHLEFQISDDASVVGSEGLPYVFKTFDLLGNCNFNEQNHTIIYTGLSQPETHLNEVMENLSVIKFSE